MEFVTFEISKKLKEKGFYEQCLGYYTKDSDFYYNTSYGSDVENAFKSFNSRPNHLCGRRIDAPTISQVLKWLREEKKIHIEIFLYDGKYSYFIKSITQICENDLFHKCLNEDTTDDEYATYEQAALTGIEYVLDNLI